MKNRKITFDTNFWISFARNPFDLQRRAMIAYLTANSTIVALEYIIKELQEKAKNKKFTQNVSDNILLLAYLLRTNTQIPVYSTSKKEDLKLKSLLRDEKDYPILQTCVDNKINYLVSGDKDLTSIWKKIDKLNYKYPIILTEKILREYFPDDLKVYEELLNEKEIHPDEELFSELRRKDAR